MSLLGVINRMVFFVSLVTWAVIATVLPENAYSQQTIANPLVRPAHMSRSSSTDSVGSEQRETQSQGRDLALERQAAIGLSQEQLLIEQQRLNNPLVPAPLVEIFRGMNVVAHYRDAVVLRNNSRQTVSSTNAEEVSGTNSSQSEAGVVSSNVLRFRVDRITQVRGYKLRASVQGPDVMVDWYDPTRGDWANVYFGTLQSGFSTTSVPTQLEERETETFDYLKPELRGMNSSSGSGGSSGSSGNSSSGGVGFSSSNN